MRNMLIVAAVGFMLVGVGCKDGKMSMPWDKKDKSSATTQPSAMKDDCPMCEGVQTARADGTCPKCNMKVKG